MAEGLQIRIVGRGRVGRGLARALKAAGVPARLVAGRSERFPPAGSGVVTLITVPDPAIETVARRLAPSVSARSVVLHCSGSLDAEVLASCRNAGANVGVMHPLVSFAAPAKPPALAGASFVIAGDRAAVRAASRVARAVGARALKADVHGPAYHAAAALAANGAAALATVAVRVLGSVGLDKRDAERAIGALLRTVGENVERVGVPNALSGPVIRGDASAVRVHRSALEALDPDARRAYDAVAPAILDCARRAGLPDERADEIRRVLKRRPR